jgi:hypothetical protein
MFGEGPHVLGNNMLVCGVALCRMSAEPFLRIVRLTR